MKTHRNLRNIMVTGGSGFIGSNFIRYLFGQPDFAGRVINVDKLTYAANPENLSDVAAARKGRYFFEHVDVGNSHAVTEIFAGYGIDSVVHFAAESHVDRSITGPAEFVTTNVLGTFTILEAAREAWKGRQDVLFHQVGTDEVFGSLGASGLFTETTPYAPRSPYSASKAGADHLVHAYFHTYGLPVTLSNCSNNYGPFQFPEKLIPVMIVNMLEGKRLPVYGQGKNVRDWLFVEDHAAAIWLIMQAGDAGGSWNVGGDNQWENIKLVDVLCEKVAAATGRSQDHYKGLISFVPDRLGHDFRYAIDCTKIKQEMGWAQSVTFDRGLDLTVRWYLDHPEWIERIRTGEYRNASLRTK
jgi:dTDP-glucose 4,6-dehydratase